MTQEVTTFLNNFKAPAHAPEAPHPFKMRPLHPPGRKSTSSIACAWNKLSSCSWSSSSSSSFSSSSIPSMQLPPHGIVPNQAPACRSSLMGCFLIKLSLSLLSLSLSHSLPFTPSLFSLAVSLSFTPSLSSLAVSLSFTLIHSLDPILAPARDSSLPESY